MLEPCTPSPAAASHPYCLPPALEGICALGLKGLNIVLIEAFKVDFIISLLFWVTDVSVSLFQTCLQERQEMGEGYTREGKEVNSGPVVKDVLDLNVAFLWHSMHSMLSLWLACNLGLNLPSRSFSGFPTDIKGLLIFVCCASAAVLQVVPLCSSIRLQFHWTSLGSFKGQARPLLHASWGSHLCSQAGGWMGLFELTQPTCSSCKLSVVTMKTRRCEWHPASVVALHVESQRLQYLHVKPTVKCSSLDVIQDSVTNAL